MKEISEYLAENILKLRKQRKLSQEQLASMAKVPRSTLTHIESGSGNPSLQNLTKISSALQVGIEELISRPRSECQLLREDEIPIHKRVQGRVRVYKLLPDKIRGLEVDKMEIEVGATMGGHPHLAGAKEYLTVVQSEITVHVAGEQFRVTRGSVLAFPGDQPHSYRNSGDRVATALSVVIPVAFGV